MKRIKQNEESNPRKKVVRIIKISVAVFLVMIFVEVWMVNRLSTYGHKIQQLKIAQDNLKLENQVLQNQVDQNTSLNTMEKKAQLLGFSNSKTVDYVKEPALASAQ